MAYELVQKAVELMGGLDVLVYNVGSGRSVSQVKRLKEWHKSLSVNLFSTTNMVEMAASELRETKG